MDLLSLHATIIILFHTANGAVDFSDFLGMMTRMERNGDTEDEIEEAFRVFDKEGKDKRENMQFYIIEKSISLSTTAAPHAYQ